MSLFQSNYAIRSQYAELDFATIEAAAGSPAFLVKLWRNSKICWLNNSTDVEMVLYAVAPTGNFADPSQLLLFTKIPANEAFDASNFFQDIEASVSFYVERGGSTAATVGKVQIMFWG
jgi:hypothetical protein